MPVLSRRIKGVEIGMLTTLILPSNDKTLSNKHDSPSQRDSCSIFTNERMGESLGFGPVLRSWNGCLNILLMLTVV